MDRRQKSEESEGRGNVTVESAPNLECSWYADSYFDKLT